MMQFDMSFRQNLIKLSPFVLLVFTQSVWSADKKQEASKELHQLVSIRPQFQEMSAQLQADEKLTQAYQAKSWSSDQAKQAQAWVDAHEKQWQVWRKHFLESSSFARGQIEEEKNMNALVLWYQWSVLQSRVQKTSQLQHKILLENLQAWAQMSADLAYEESSLIGMRFSSVMRNMVFDELESFVQQQQSVETLKETLRLLKHMRAPWPVDRVILAETKKLLGESGLKAVQSAVNSLQKNPYQSLSGLVRKADLKRYPKLEFIVKMWTENDISRMQDEINRRNLLLINCAKKIYVLTQNQEPKSLDELVSKGLLDSVPIDYKTGQKMQ